MKGPLVLVWFALSSLVSTKPVLEGNEYGASNDQLNYQEDYYEGSCNFEGSYPNYDSGYDDNIGDIETNKKCSDFVKLITSSYKSSIATQLSMELQSTLVKQMEGLVLYIQDKVVLDQGKQEVGQDFVFNNLWAVLAQSRGQQMSSIFKGMVHKYVGFVEKTFNVFLEKEKCARIELEYIIADGVDSLASYTQQKDWKTEEVSQFEEDAGCFYDFIKSELNYTMGGMAKEDFENTATSLAHSLNVIATSQGVKTTITNIAMDAAKKLKTINFEEIKNELFEAFDIVSDTIVQSVEVIDRGFQYGVWQMALGNPVPRLDDLILKAIQVVKSDRFWIETRQLQGKVVMRNISPAILVVVDLVLELSNQVDVANGLETLAATVQEAVASVRIDGQEMATVVEDYLFLNIEDYLAVLENLGSLDLASLMPLLRYEMENTKPRNDNEEIGTLDDGEKILEESIFPDDNDQDKLKEVSTDHYGDIQEKSGTDEVEDYKKIVKEDITIEGEDSLDGYKEIVEDDLVIEDEVSSDGYKEIVKEDISILEIEDNNIEIQAENDKTDIIEENNTGNIEIEEDYAAVYQA